MPKEYEIEDSEDYEVMPVTPIRKLEKRLARIESTKSMSNLERLMDKIIDMVELNQRIVDEMVRANTGLREQIEVLIGKMDKLQEKVGNFIDIVAEAGKEEEAGAETAAALKSTIEPLIAGMAEANEKLLKSNEAIVESLATIDKRLKRSAAPTAAPVTVPAPAPQTPAAKPPA